MNENININPQVLLNARKFLKLDYEKVSKRSKISIQDLKEIESGRKPNLKELSALAKVYNKSLASLLLYKSPQAKPLPKDRRTVKSEQLGLFDIKTIRVIEKARALGDSYIRLKNKFNIPILRFSYFASLADNPNDVAKQLRKEWNLNKLKELSGADTAFEGFIEIIEKIGVSIFQLPLTKDNLRGFSIIDEELPIIVIKRGSEPTTAKIFTLFHEIGHLLLNESGICDVGLNNQQQIEKWCNAFASEILVPSNELLLNDIVAKYKSTGNKDWLKNDLIEIGKEFFVGPLVIMRKLFEHKLTTKNFYEKRLKSWNKSSFGRAKEPKGREIPKEIVKERGKTFIGLAFIAYEQNRINLKELSDYLGAKLSYIPQIRQHLYG